MQWPTALEWVGMIGTLGTLTSLVLAWGGRGTKKILQGQDATLAKQDTTLAQQNVTLARLGEILAQMETNAGLRHGEVMGKLEERPDAT